METLGRPQDRLPRVIHIAGTNGKGSVAAMLAGIARAAGLSAHIYTSPHLVRFNERITLAGAPIEDAPLLALLERVEAANAGQAVTFFEATTAAAFLAFAETPADLTILETGLGGRFDATNVVPAPACAVITAVGYDHMEFLGDDIARIAMEKAGIMKPGAPVVIGPQAPEARAVLAASRGGGAPRPGRPHLHHDPGRSSSGAQARARAACLRGREPGRGAQGRAQRGERGHRVGARDRDRQPASQVPVLIPP